MRSQIIHLTLHQEGSAERGRAKLKHGDEKKKQATREGRGRDKRSESKQERKRSKAAKRGSRLGGWGKKGEGGKGVRWREPPGETERKRKWGRLNAIVRPLSGRQNGFIAQSCTVSSRVFSAPMMTIANLCKDMDYTGAKLATKRSIIHVLFSAWPRCLYKAPIRAAVYFIAGGSSDSDLEGNFSQTQCSKGLDQSQPISFNQTKRGQGYLEQRNN